MTLSEGAWAGWEDIDITESQRGILKIRESDMDLILGRTKRDPANETPKQIVIHNGQLIHDMYTGHQPCEFESGKKGKDFNKDQSRC